MKPMAPASDEVGPLVGAGLTSRAAKAWLHAEPRLRGDFRTDSAACAKFWAAAARLRAQLPAKPLRNRQQAAASTVIGQRERALRESFLARHAATTYDRLTNNRKNFVRAGELVLAAAKLVPGLTPTARQLAAEAPLMLNDKEGLEVDQGLFL